MSQARAPCPRSRKRKGRTALHYAVLMDDIELVHILLAGGMDIDIRDDEGLTPHELARRMPPGPRRLQ